MSKYLFLALSSKGFGETILGVQVARALHERGHEATFLIHESSTKLLESTAFNFMTISEHVGPLLPMFVTELVDQLNPASIVLADFFTTDLWLDHHGLDRGFLKQYGIPLIAIDTWCIGKTGTDMDIYWQKSRCFEDWTEELDLVIQPAPMAPVNGGPHVYSCLPDTVSTAHEVREQLRARLGLSLADKIVLFCTAAWQQTRYSCDIAQRVAAMLPQLLARYFARLGPNVHLLHIGKAPYKIKLNGRYHWLSQMEPPEFDVALGGTDLLLTPNISSTTIAKALVSEVPVLAVINSFELKVPKDLTSLPFALDDEDAGPWASENLPLYRYYMWPVGYFEFLKPLLCGSEYLRAISTVELLDRQRFVTSIDTLLQRSDLRAKVLERQTQYVDTLRGLPSPAELVMQVT